MHRNRLNALVQSRRGEERGGVVLVVILLSVASMLVLITLSSVSSGLTRASDDQTRSNAFQFANAGIDQALYRIETKPPSVSSSTSGTSYTPTISSGQVVGFTETFVKNKISYKIVAVQTPVGQDTVWRVNSTGTDPSGKVRQAVADIQATSLFENGFFTTNEFYISGNQFKNNPVAYNSLACPTAVASCGLPLPVATRLGSNTGFPIDAPATIRAMIDEWSGFAIYGQATVEDAQALCGSNTKCHTVQDSANTRYGNVTAVPEKLVIEMPKPWVRNCPNNGRLGSVFGRSTLAPGDYRCDKLTIQGTLDLTGTGNVRFYVDSELSIVPGKSNVATVVNRHQRPVRFQLYLPAQPAGSANNSQVCGSEIWALLYTPGLDVNCNGASQTSIYGAVVARFHRGTGNQFNFHWDSTSATALNNGKYRVENWRECPPGTVDC